MNTTLRIAADFEQLMRESLDRLRIYGPREFVRREAATLGMKLVWLLPKPLVSACVVRALAQNVQPDDVVMDVTVSELLRRMTA